VAGERNGVVLARVTEPAIEGRANVALVKLIAKRTGVAKGRVNIVRGERSRDKTVRVDGLSLAEVRQALGLRGAQSSNSA
jgi:uncharacterized protein